MDNHFKSIGDIIYSDISDNEYLKEIHENLLYNYALSLFQIPSEKYKTINISDALRFADILSKSNHRILGDQHKMLSQEVIATLNHIYPYDDKVSFYAGSVLTNTGNFQGLNIINHNYHSIATLENVYTEFAKDYLTIPALPELKFMKSQRKVYEHLKDNFFSYSGPTSMGKSFIMRMYIKEEVQAGIQKNYAIIVPTKALINEVSSKIINDLTNSLKEKNYRLITSAGALALNEDHNFIFVLTPERLLYLLISNPKIKIDYLFIDEAQKLSEMDSRSPFYYKIIDKLIERTNKPQLIFASPNIPNPWLYLNDIDEEASYNQFATKFSPVTQFKFLVNFEKHLVSIYNEQATKFIPSIRLRDNCNLNDFIHLVSGHNHEKVKQNIIYCNSIHHAVDLARSYAETIEHNNTDSELLTLSKEIANQVHGDYYLAEIIKKGVAYHVGYLPSAIRMQIEELFRQGLITTIFCTSTLVEGVNMPADNLFVLHYKKGRSYMNPIDFKNLIGRVGRIEYNLFGNVFLICGRDKVKEENYIELITTEIPEQKLSIDSALTSGQKRKIIEALASGNVEFEKHPKNQTNDNYVLMRKFALILLKDIMSKRNSLVYKNFSEYLSEELEEKIREHFNQGITKPDDDINVSVDQTENLTVAIQNGLSYPTFDEDGHVSYEAIVIFLERLCKIFKWEKYEHKTLGYKNKDTGSHNKLRWYAVILLQWIQGAGLSFIVNKAIEYQQDKPNSIIMVNNKPVEYNDSKEHRNVVISDTLNVIDGVILFSISNYFLRFSNEYKKFHNVESFSNDWYEYVEYGTRNPLTIFLQRNGFSRETSNYIKEHKIIYVAMLDNGEIKLSRSLLNCNNKGVCKEAKDIQYNAPDIFI
ncbi:DEAD/DEAH box helicase [Eubacteriales bacterium KG125]